LEGASHALEISRDDIDGALSWSADQRRSIVVYDTVPGGAGAAKRIAENIEVVLKTYNRNVEGRSVPAWDVFLSEIKVISTKA